MRITVSCGAFVRRARINARPGSVLTGHKLLELTSELFGQEIATAAQIFITEENGTVVSIDDAQGVAEAWERAKVREFARIWCKLPRSVASHALTMCVHPYISLHCSEASQST